MNKITSDYYSQCRYEIIDIIENGSNKILEIGTGTGETLIRLKHLDKANEIVGVEINSQLKKIVNNFDSLDNIIFGDIEKIEIGYKEKYFDIIICADVLEHLIEPSSTLIKLRKYLDDDGKLICSVPNFREIFNFYNIFLRGDFKYSDSGILDETHLRFFCKKNIINILNKSGFKIVKIIMSKGRTKIRPILNKLTLGVFEEFIAFQYIIECKKI